MIEQPLMDAGPLVAFSDRSDQYHPWAEAIWPELALPLYTCEAVVAEACWLLRRRPPSVDSLMAAMASQDVVALPVLATESGRVGSMMRQYRNVPMDLGDACLVRLAEVHQGFTIVTLDSDFQIYRTSRGQPLDVLMPSLA